VVLGSGGEHEGLELWGSRESGERDGCKTEGGAGRKSE